MTRWDLKVLEQVEKLARNHYDGHVTIMRFTTGWKVVFSTPNMNLEDRDFLWELPPKMSFQQACERAVEHGDAFD